MHGRGIGPSTRGHTAASPTISNIPSADRPGPGLTRRFQTFVVAPSIAPLGIRRNSTQSVNYAVLGLSNENNMDSLDAELFRLKDTIQDSHLNILIGSGLSTPYFHTLGNVEILLTELAAATSCSTEQRKIALASIYKHYFDIAIARNTDLKNDASTTNGTLHEYERLLTVLNAILLRRDVTLLNREINLFTTNIDIFLEKALEQLQLEFNDGFSGRFKPSFSLSNFKKTHFKKSLQYDNVAEIPVFNLSKLHGSLSWQVESPNIVFSHTLAHIDHVRSLAPDDKYLVPINDKSTISDLLKGSESIDFHNSITKFIESYEESLAIVNPSKDKFRHTLMNQTYYELLRLYSNELEKENTTLLVLGFSFADEHIREITLRAANSNPTLLVQIVCHTTAAMEEIKARLDPRSIKNRNVRYISPVQEVSAGKFTDTFQYNLEAINDKLMQPLLHVIGKGRAATGT